MNDTKSIPGGLHSWGFSILASSYQDEIAYRKGEFTQQYWQLPMQNYKLGNSPFYFSDSNDFTHFTSINALKGMLSSRSIRLYSLADMDDKLEFAYGEQALLFPKGTRAANHRSQLYSFSLCDSRKILGSEEAEHLLWKLYGDNGSGVMIRFTFKNDLAGWEQYHLSKIYYELKQFRQVPQFHKRRNPRILIDPKLNAFIKHPIYGFESEVRLLADFRTENAVTTQLTDQHGKIFYPRIGSQIAARASPRSFLEIPLTNFFTEMGDFYGQSLTDEWERKIPAVSITEITLGYRQSSSQFVRNKRWINQLGLKIPVVSSGLARYFKIES